MALWIGPNAFKRLMCAVLGHDSDLSWDGEFAAPGHEDLIRACRRCELNEFAGGQTRPAAAA